MRLNTPLKPDRFTHEGAPAKRINAEQELRRSVLSCLLWENEFYENGESIAARIVSLGEQVPAKTLADLAVEARTRFHLRHVPLLLLSVLARTGSGSSLVSDTIYSVIGRADELAEFVAIYAQVNGVHPGEVKKRMSAQVKRGLARAFTKFDAYQLAKYDRAGAVRLRDVLFLSHPKPANDEQAATWKALVDGTLVAPDTWEVALSGGEDKKATWERLLSEGKLGYLALLRNLRGMMDAGVDRKLVSDAIVARKGAKNVLPFRFAAAARACPQLEPAIDQALCESVLEMPILGGHTIILVDVSGSMGVLLSHRSDMTRLDAAATLASVIHGDRRVFTFSNALVEVAPRHGMSGVDAIRNSQPRGGTYIGAAVQKMNELPHDRLIVITDEQSYDPVPDPVAKRAYMINVASNRNGIGYTRWTHIDGFSEAVLRFIVEYENDA